jgi:hypothetical protein
MIDEKEPTESEVLEDLAKPEDASLYIEERREAETSERGNCSRLRMKNFARS